MATALGTDAAITSHLDTILIEICKALQLTTTQFDDAKQKYEAVGEWLAGDGSQLQVLRPSIYPQGSMALQTTCRPWRREEFDVDLVCQLAATAHGPMQLLDQVGRRLSEHKYYASILEPLKRCWRLNYAGDFHLDILPAKEDTARGGTAILVPDRKLRDWKESDPKGYAQWYHARARSLAWLEARKTEPLPDNDPAVARPPLSRAVQLIKRRRDFYFAGNESAPRSIVLTTLAGHFYRAEPSVYAALLQIVRGMAEAILATPGVMVVPNPANEAENFAESWQSHPEDYEQFKTFVRDVYAELEELPSLHLRSSLPEHLGELFGEREAKMAVNAYAERVNSVRERGLLRVAPSVGIAPAVTKSRPIPRNTFFGSDG
jgi:hypothetical protein